MNLSKVEKTIIMVLVVALIVGIGGWFFAWPAFQEIGKAETKVKNLETERTNIYASLERETTIDQEIEDAKKEAVKFEENFYPDLTTYEAVEVTLAHLKDSNLETLSISASPMSTYTIALQTFSKGETVYNLKTYAQAARTDVEEEVLAEGQFKDGNKVYTVTVNSITDVQITDEDGKVIEIKDYTEAMEKAHKEMVVKTAVAQNRTQTVGLTTANFEVRGRYEDYLKFIDYIYDAERATYMSSVVIQMTAPPQEDEEYINEDGSIVSGADAGEDAVVFCSPDTEVSASISLMYLSVEQMEEMETLEIAGEKIVVNQ